MVFEMIFLKYYKIPKGLSKVSKISFIDPQIELEGTLDIIYSHLFIYR